MTPKTVLIKYRSIGVLVQDLSMNRISIARALDESNYVLMAGLDLSAAFDILFGTL